MSKDKEQEMKEVLELIESGTYPTTLQNFDLSVPLGLTGNDGEFVVEPVPGMFFVDPLVNELRFQRMS